MSLRCSLLGHEYGETEIERDREERGDEVVITVVELERCARCGNERTISENTEVTQLSRSGSEPSPGSTGSTVSADSAAETESTATASDVGAESEPNAETERSGIGPRPFEPDPDDEDTEIIEGSAEADDERDPGAWPDVGDHESRPNADAADPWPDAEGEDEGFDATTPDGKTDVEFGDGLTPRSDQGAEIIESGGTNETETVDEPTFVSAGPTPGPERSADPGGETTLFCPNCDESGLGERDSLRAGDICPECHRGYLAEREH